MREFILLGCIAVLLVVLIHVSNTVVRFHDVVIQVHCENRDDFLKCSQEFKEKTSKLMKGR